MKKLIPILCGGVGGFLFAIVLLHALPATDMSHFPQQVIKVNNKDTTIKLNNHSNMVCGTPFFDSAYVFAKESFSEGVENIVPSEFEENTFNFIRASDSFPGNKEVFIAQIKNTTKQVIDIVKEDPSVLDTCENFRIAMFGPL